ESTYRPDASTPLYDAIGFGVAKLERQLEGVENYNVLVTVLTDGEENSSREYTLDAIKKKIDALQRKRWTYTYTGTDHDVYRSAIHPSITNVMHFSKDDAAMKSMFLKEQVARMDYSRKIRTGDDTGKDFYKQ